MIDKIYERRDDMSATGKLQVTTDLDGDIIIGIVKYDNDDADDPENGWLNVEFCTMVSGGGRSEHTRAALIELMKAIEKDNEERPIL